MSIAGIRVDPDAKFGEESLELSSAHARSNREHLDRKSRDEQGRYTFFGGATSACSHRGIKPPLAIGRRVDRGRR